MNTRQDTSRHVRREPVKTPEGGDIERWDVDPAGSRFGFALRHLIVQRIEGAFRAWGGTLYLDRVDPGQSSVDVWVDLASIDTGSPERDDHIRSPEFLDIARVPRAEFQSTSIELRGTQAIVHGLLQLHGVTHDLDLEIGPGKGPSDAASRSYTVKGTLDRQAFGLHWNQDLDVGGIVLGDEVVLTAEVRVVRANDDAEGVD